MSKELTEQWLNGTLKKGNYYVNAKDFYNGDLYKGEIDHFNGEAHWFRFAGVEEVLSAVPSYDEHNELKQDNKYLKSGIETRDKQIEQLEKRLEIATKALKRIDPPNIIFDDYRNSGIDLWEIAHNALKEMEGVK